ncbi:MAG: cupin domain-containing protein [Hyphomonadaceae bacterium]
MKLTSGSLMDDASRAALASGRAEPSVALFLDVLMEMRGISEGEGEAIAGAVLETEAPVTMSINALEMALAAIERGPAAPPKRAMAYPDLTAVPAILQDAILAAEAGRGWSLYGPGIRRLPLGLAGKAKADVLRIDPGVAVPWHTHKGQELTLCLVGEYTDGSRKFGPGDFSVADGTVRHRPVAHRAGHVYALAVTDAGLKFEGLLGALQKLLGG